MKMYEIQIDESENGENIILTQENYGDDDSLVLISYAQLPLVIHHLEKLLENNTGE